MQHARHARILPRIRIKQLEWDNLDFNHILFQLLSPRWFPAPTLCDTRPLHETRKTQFEFQLMLPLIRGHRFLLQWLTGNAKPNQRLKTLIHKQWKCQFEFPLSNCENPQSLQLTPETPRHLWNRRTHPRTRLVPNPCNYLRFIQWKTQSRRRWST